MASEISFKADLSNLPANELIEDFLSNQERSLIEEGLEHIDQGISIFDNDLRLVAANHRFCKLLGFPEHFADHGTSLETMFRYNALRGEYGAGDIDRLVLERLAKARKNEAHCFQRVRPDGIVLEIRGVPIEGFGFVSTYTDITERLENAEAVRNSKERFQDMARAASDWFWETDPNGQFTFLSDRFYSTLGVSPHHIIGKTRQQICDPTSLQDHHLNWQAYQEAIDTQTPFRGFEYRFRGARPTPYILKVSGVPVFGKDGSLIGYRGTGTDITALKEAEKALEDSARKFREMLDTSAAGVAITCKETKRFKYVNPRFAELCQTSLTEMASCTPSTFHHDKAHWKDILGRFAKEGIIRDEEVKFMLPDGTTSWVLLSMQNTQFEGSDCAIAWFFDVTELHNSREELSRLAQTDPLTGLPNRRLFKSLVERAISRSIRHKKQGALIYFDLDGFKQINDNYGHDIGDQLLRQVGKRVTEHLRANDVLSRLGGDEFTILIEDLESPGDVEIVAQKILACLHRSFEISDAHYAIGASIGITLFSNEQVHADELITQADRAMYMAKQSGRGCIRYFQK